MDYKFKSKFLLMFLPTVVVLFIVEIFCLEIFFQRRSSSDLSALVFYGKKAFLSAMHGLAESQTSDYLYDQKSLYDSNGANVLAYFEKEYEKHFILLRDAVAKNGSAFYVLYLPSENPIIVKEKTREFYKNLTKRFDVPFWDFSSLASEHDSSEVFLTPEGGHLSRYGNKLVAKLLMENLSRVTNYNSSQIFLERPNLLGGLEPNISEVWSYKPEMPYKVNTNSQGFRRNDDLKFPKTKKRILVLGDSFTFGPYLPNYHTYPYLLEAILGEVEVVNAGVPGYTIEDEASLFIERSKYIEPEIVILQVLDNDLPDFFWFKRNEFARSRNVYKPTESELEFLAANRIKK